MANIIRLEARKRITTLFFIMGFLIILLSLRLVWIQVINSESYQQKALDQRLRQIKVEPKRGIIYDRNHKKLAVSSSSETVVAIPGEIENPELTARKLSQVLSRDYDYIYGRITRLASAVYVERKIDDEIATMVRKLDLPGITFTEESKRYYPNDSLASHVLGFAGIDSQGLDGLELAYDRYLQGLPGRIQSERDIRGRNIPGGIEEYVAAKNGYSLHLTIDEVIQYIVERELNRAMNDFSISGGTIIVMDPKTGGILALANRPDYNPNNFAAYPQRDWRNRGISDSYEPGSTFKIITLTSALEEGVVNENDIFTCPGHILVSGERINCWDTGGHGSQNLIEVAQHSCNPGFVQVGMRLGSSAFYNYITAFGFGDKTNINLPGEARGLMYNYDQIGPVELATMAFGHGITVTPIQMVTAVSAIANQGMLLQPRLVDEIRTAEGELVEKNEAIQIRQVISAQTATRTLELLEKVVSEDGTGRNAAIEGYRIGGKTGTAKHYGAQIYDSSFVGIVPIDDPQLVIMVVFYDVTGYPYYGSWTAAPIFRNVALDTLRYLEIPPQLTADKQEESPYVSIPNVLNLDINQAVEKLRAQGLEVRVAGGQDKVVTQVPLAGAKVREKTTIILFTDQAGSQDRKYLVAVPDLSGLRGNEAANLLAEIGLKLRQEGEGIIVKQDIKPGSRVAGGTTVNVKLQENI